MKNYVVGLFLALALLFTVPTFGQSNAPAPPQTQAEAKLPISIVLVTDPNGPVTPAVQTFVDGLKTALGDGFVISTEKPKTDAPTQYVIAILGFGSTTANADGKIVPTNVLTVLGLLHRQGHEYPTYLFGAPIQLDNGDQVPTLVDSLLITLGGADDGIAQSGGADKL
jgi:hypothetical protein